MAGVLVVAHDKGEVRVYQHSTEPREVTCCHLGPGTGCGPASRSQVEWQHRSVLGHAFLRLIIALDA